MYCAYEGYPGPGTRTSSPGSMKVPIMTLMHSLTPAVTYTSSGEMETPFFLNSLRSIASLRSCWPWESPYPLSTWSTASLKVCLKYSGVSKSHLLGSPMLRLRSFMPAAAASAAGTVTSRIA